jgi:hypothetical protein
MVGKFVFAVTLCGEKHSLDHRFQTGSWDVHGSSVNLSRLKGKTDSTLVTIEIYRPTP